MTTFKLYEPIKHAIIDRLENDLPAVIDEINAEADDGYELRVPEAIFPHVPSVGLLRTWPTLGIQKLPGALEDDIGSSAVARCELAVLAFDQSADLLELGWRLERWERALATVLLAGRELGQGGDAAYSVSLVATRPGPTLGDAEDPAQVKTYTSWCAVVIRCLRDE